MTSAHTARPSAAIFVAGLILSPLSCKHSQSNNAALGQVHHGVGVVESIDKEMAAIQINHEAIKDYMPAMSMPYTARDRSLLDVVHPGDRVEFSLETTSKGDVLTEIKKIIEAKAPTR